MPVLKNPRHERFAQLLASGKSGTAAYELAGYKPSDSNGSDWREPKKYETGAVNVYRRSIDP